MLCRLASARSKGVVAARSGRLVHEPRTEASDSDAAVFAFTPSAAPQLCALISAVRPAAGLRIEGLAWDGAVRTFELDRLPDETVQLIDVRSRLALLAPEPQGDHPHPLTLGALDDPASHFRLVALADQAPTGVQALAEALSQVLVDKALASLAACSRGDLESDFDLAQAMGQAMSRTEIDGEARRLIQAPGACELFSGFGARDPWASSALPLLVGWLRDRDSAPATVQVDERYDFLAGAGADSYPATLAAACTKALRCSARPRQRLCALAVARNEGLYLLDWLAHHLACGVGQFFIYTNDNTDGSDILLQRLHDHGVIRLYRNEVGPGVGPQLKAYAHALQFVPDMLDYEWTALMDLDEFVMLNTSKFRDVPSYLNWIEPTGADSVALSWTFQGPNGGRRWSDEPVTTRFPCRAAPDQHVKSIFRPQRFSSAHPHFPHDDPDEPRRYTTADGGAFRAWSFNDEPSCRNAWSAHFYYKSAEEFLVRRLRNRADVAVSDRFDDSLISPPLANLYVEMFRHPEVYGESDEAPVDVREWKARLKALPGVAAAEEACQAAYATEVALARNYLSHSTRFQTSGSQEAALFQLAFGDV